MGNIATKLASKSAEFKSLFLGQFPEQQLTDEEIVAFVAHSYSIYAVAVTPDGKTAVAAGGEKTLKMWNQETKAEIASFIAEHSILCCAVSSDRLRVVAGDQSGQIHFLQLEGGSKNE